MLPRLIAALVASSLPRAPELGAVHPCQHNTKLLFLRKHKDNHEHVQHYYTTSAFALRLHLYPRRQIAKSMEQTGDSKLLTHACTCTHVHTTGYLFEWSKRSNCLFTSASNCTGSHLGTTYTKFREKDRNTHRGPPHKQTASFRK